MTVEGQAVAVFHAEYQRVFRAGGDAQDHDEATESAVAAVLEMARLYWKET